MSGRTLLRDDRRHRRRSRRRHDRRHVLPQTGEPYVESLETRRYGRRGRGPRSFCESRYVVTARGALARQRHDTSSARVAEARSPRHRVRRSRGAWQCRPPHVGCGRCARTRRLRSRPTCRNSLRVHVPGVFVQDDLRRHASGCRSSSSGRLDCHSDVRDLLQPSHLRARSRHGRWNSRLSFGTGFFASSPLTEETEAAGLTRLESESPIEAERGRSASCDVSRTDGPLSYTVTLFALAHRASTARRSVDGLVLTNLAGPDDEYRSRTARHATPRAVLRSRRPTPTCARGEKRRGDVAADVPLTPRHSAGLVGMWEREDVGRVGVEWYYTGVAAARGEPVSQRPANRTWCSACSASGSSAGCGCSSTARTSPVCVRRNWDPLLAAFARGRRPLDRGRVGAARRPERQRRRPRSVLTVVESSPAL